MKPRLVFHLNSKGGQMPLVSAGIFEKNPLPDCASTSPLLVDKTKEDVAGGTTPSRKEAC